MLDNFDKNKNPFKVPENYFENFNAEMMSKLPQKEEPRAKVVSLWKKVLPWTAAAAVLSGVIFSTGILNDNHRSSQLPINNTTAVVSSVEEEDYYMFLEEEVNKSQFKEMMYSY